MAMENYSLSDIAAITGSNGEKGEGGWFWIIILFLFMFGLGGNGFGLGGRATDASLTRAELQSEIQSGLNNNMVVGKLDSIGNGICNSSYENARLVDGVNANLNSGFNSVNTNLNNGVNSINANITNLSYMLEKCCCDLKTQMLQDKYDATQYQLTQANGIIANTTQTQYILGQLGRYYTYPAVNPYSCYGSNGTLI